MKDNFWEMGDTGPCGPCSELHYDRIGGGRNAADRVNKDDPDVIEIWNLVFIQYNRESDGSLKPLPGKHVDTGMGFERITSIIQDKRSNYDTDLFMPIFEAIHKGTGTRPYSGNVGDEDVDKVDMAYRVVADHIRTLVIAISDGGRPDNVGRGYVLRRILRRGIRFAIKKLNAKPHFFSSLVDVVVNLLGDAFPEVQKDPQFVKDVINEEEDQFLKTLSRGQKLLEKTMVKLNTNIFPGDIAWRLYDTYGFPIDLTQLICEESGLAVDMKKFNEAKQLAQLQSQNIGNGQEETIVLDGFAIDELKKKLFSYTNDLPKYNYKSDELGNYNLEACRAKIKAIRVHKSFVDEIQVGQQCGLLLDQTSFYAEQGGQTYDEGYLTRFKMDGAEDEDLEFIVKNVQIFGGFILHVGLLESSNIDAILRVGDEVNLQVDLAKRRLVMNNHTSTHLLNFALRDVLKEADQRGSLVLPDKFRFDFSCKAAMKIEEIVRTEEIIQEIITKNYDIYSKEAPLSLAKEIKGLRAVFDEAYPDPVRIVSIGRPVEDLIAEPQGNGGINYSVEFCGGTHLHKSGHINRMIITSEEAISKGIRRIVGISGPEAQKAMKKCNELRNEISQLALELEDISRVGHFNSNGKSQKSLLKQMNTLNDHINTSQISYIEKETIRNDLKALKKIIDDIEKKEKQALLSKAMEESKELMEKLLNDNPNLDYFVKEFSVNGDAKSLNNILTQFKSKFPDACCMLFSIDKSSNKILCISSVPDVSFK
jgi:alanyl-tRNA synthetase